MDDSKKTTTTGKNTNEPLTRLQQRQQLIRSPREFQDTVLKHMALIRAFDDNDNDNPEMRARREMLKEQRRKLLGIIRNFLKGTVDLASAEVAMIILFQILQNTTKATIREGGGEGGGMAVEFEVEDEEHTNTTSMFEIICIDHGKDTAMDIVHDLLNKNDMNITTALGYASTGYGEGKVQRECVYYLLRKHQELTHMYRKLMENMIRGNTIELGLIAIFMQNKEDNNNSITTWFQTACHRLGRNIVDEIIEDILQQQQLAVSSSVLSRSSVNTMLALEHAAAINDNSNNKNHDQTHSVHVDGFYFLLRRQPDVLLRCSSSSSSNNSSTITSSSNSPTSLSEAGVVAAAARDSSHKLADEGCTTSRKIRKRKRIVK